MKKVYKKPELKERKLSIACILETSPIDVGGDTNHFDAKQNGIFDRLNGVDEEE